MLVVRDYNEILDTLERDERLLFHEHIRRLDRRINGGLTRFTWASKTVIEWYVKECRKHCADLNAIVQGFKVNRELIKRNCRRIATTLLINIEKVRGGKGHGGIAYGI